VTDVCGIERAWAGASRRNTDKRVDKGTSTTRKHGGGVFRTGQRPGIGVPFSEGALRNQWRLLQFPRDRTFGSV
jgi:hypothetical protein